jgi:hypothetical protein
MTGRWIRFFLISLMYLVLKVLLFQFRAKLTIYTILWMTLFSPTETLFEDAILYVFLALLRKPRLCPTSHSGKKHMKKNLELLKLKELMREATNHPIHIFTVVTNSLISRLIIMAIQLNINVDLFFKVIRSAMDNHILKFMLLSPRQQLYAFFSRRNSARLVTTSI